MQAIESFELGNFTVKIYPDDSPESPRTWSNLGIMVCFDRHHTIGDKHSFSDLDEVQDYLKSQKGSVVLGLWFDKNSGISCSQISYPYNDDNGQCGYTFVTPETIREEYKCKRISKDIRELATKVLRQEVEIYNQYINGDVYGYQIENEQGEHIDSCWGFYGLDECIEQAKDSAKYYTEQETNKSAAMVTFFTNEDK